MPIEFEDAWRDDIATEAELGLGRMRKQHPGEEFRIYWICDRDIGAVDWGIEMVVGRRFFGLLRAWRKVYLDKSLEQIPLIEADVS